MTSRLASRKKKYQTPQQEPPDDSNGKCSKEIEEQGKSKTKSYADIAKLNNLINTNKDPERNVIKTYAEISKSSKKIEPSTSASSSSNIYDENELFTKAVRSAKQHKIKLKPGRKDRGYGNCVFEAVINNINDRACFKEKLFQTPNWYRWSWMNQMMEKLVTGISP